MDFALFWNADPYHSERSRLYIGQGKTMLSRSGIFRVPEGVAVDMCNRVFNLHSFHGMFIIMKNYCSIYKPKKLSYFRLCDFYSHSICQVVHTLLWKIVYVNKFVDSSLFNLVISIFYLYK